MKRFHVHVGVTDLDASIRFYSSLFGVPPAVHKPDYAKWMIDEPRVNFAMSTGNHVGVSHLGLEGDSADELAAIRQRFAAADPRIEDEPNAACCHARSDKHWATDPQGIRWESFLTHGSAPTYFAPAEDAACCGPVDAAAAPTKCCGPGATSAARCGGGSQ